MERWVGFGLCAVLFLFLGYHAFQGIVRRQLTVRYRPIRLMSPSEDNDYIPMKQVETKGWLAVTIGVVYAMGALLALAGLVACARSLLKP